jgi:cyclic pyranopterin phosphate synthase
MNNPIPSHLLPRVADLLDRRGRALRDLRISITDRCNFRCTYCMPKAVFDKDYPYLARSSLLSFEEIERVARLAVDCGVSKIRLTGGEPLLRRGVESLVERLARIPGIDLALTTNGALLARKARSLRDAGLGRLTVSLDALDDDIFQRMNDVNFPVAQVLEGIAEAERVGFTGIKINAVIQKGVNEGEILALCRQFHGSDHIPRFIEYMDVGSCNGWRMDQVLPSSEVLARIEREFPLVRLGAHRPGEVAERWRYKDGGGEVGVISSVTQAFCGDCTRLRLSTDGRLYTCLFARNGLDVKTPLRLGMADDEIRALLATAWHGRDDHYSELRAQGLPTPGTVVALKRIEMSYIGG